MSLQVESIHNIIIIKVLLVCICGYLFFLFLFGCLVSPVAVCSKLAILADSSSSCFCMFVSSVACRSAYLSTHLTQCS